MAVPYERVRGWVERYDAAHPQTRWTAGPDEVSAVSPDGTHVQVAVPFAPLAEASIDGLLGHLVSDWQVGVILARRGGFAVARLTGAEMVDWKVGRRHVQGRSKAGGWSQQRFARRRANQAREAFDAAAGHAVRILGPYATALDLVATGGDRGAVREVLAHRDLAAVTDRPQRWLGGVANPNRAVLDQAVRAVRSVQVTITDPAQSGHR
ncbi:MAG: acVLRF1 family peptidyl-tRNA hydrolase [Nocardioidaceae bacterium]